MAKSLFLDPELADADGLVGVGGDLGPTRLLEAYSRGIFPFFSLSVSQRRFMGDPDRISAADETEAGCSAMVAGAD